MTQEEFGAHLDNWIKSMDVSNIDELVRWGPALMLQAEKYAAEAWKNSYIAKRNVKEVESKAWEHIAKTKSGPGGKPLSQKMTDILVEREPTVIEAHLKYAQAEQMKKELEGMTDTLRRTLGLLPGLQGRANSLLEV